MWGRDVVRLFRARWGLGRVLSDLVSKYTLSKGLLWRISKVRETMARQCCGYKYASTWLPNETSILRRGFKQGATNGTHTTAAGWTSLGDERRQAYGGFLWSAVKAALTLGIVCVLICCFESALPVPAYKRLSKAQRYIEKMDEILMDIR
jgi:hypothetical protein